MRRREFITLVGGAAVAWPLAARAQQAAMPTIGYLVIAEAHDNQATLVPFLQGLRQTGYTEGSNVRIETRTADNHLERLPALAAELVNSRVALIFATQGAAPALAAKAATNDIPIVFANGGDPVKLGLVKSLNRPEGNVTGISFLLNALGGKRLELLHELAPTAKVIGFLANPNNASSRSETADVEAAANKLGIQLIIINATTELEIDAAFASFHEQNIDAFLNESDIFLDTRREQIVGLAARYRIPAIYHLRHFATSGGLMAYGTSVDDAQRVAGIYAGRILKGAKPGDLPVQQSTRIELIINLKTAKSLGLTFPLTLLGRADEVIE